MGEGGGCNQHRFLPVVVFTCSTQRRKGFYFSAKLLLQGTGGTKSQRTTLQYPLSSLTSYLRISRTLTYEGMFSDLYTHTYI